MFCEDDMHLTRQVRIGRFWFVSRTEDRHECGADFGISGCDQRPGPLRGPGLRDGCTCTAAPRAEVETHQDPHPRAARGPVPRPPPSSTRVPEVLQHLRPPGDLRVRVDRVDTEARRSRSHAHHPRLLGCAPGPPVRAPVRASHTISKPTYLGGAVSLAPPTSRAVATRPVGDLSVRLR